MDYKKLVENLKEWHRTICKMCGDDILTCDDLCGCTGDCVVVQAITAITDLLTENQALRNAANGFKKQLDAAESRAEKAERERDAAVFDLLRAEESAEETNVLLDVEVHPACDYSLYLAVHDSVSDIVNWEHDDVWRGHKEEKE